MAELCSLCMRLERLRHIPITTRFIWVVNCIPNFRKNKLKVSFRFLKTNRTLKFLQVLIAYKEVQKTKISWMSYVLFEES